MTWTRPTRLTDPRVPAGFMATGPRPMTKASAQAWGYIAPREIAAILKAEIAPAAEILDIGAGTGLVAEHLRGLTVDALDITPGDAGDRPAQGPLSQPHPGGPDQDAGYSPTHSYDAVISCGTFTHGHVGPECLPGTAAHHPPRRGLRLRNHRPGAGRGRASARPLRGWWHTGRITPVDWRDIPIYEGADASAQGRPRAGDGVPPGLYTSPCRLGRARPICAFNSGFGVHTRSYRTSQAGRWVRFFVSGTPCPT